MATSALPTQGPQSNLWEGTKWLHILRVPKAGRNKIGISPRPSRGHDCINCQWAEVATWPTKNFLPGTALGIHPFGQGLTYPAPCPDT